MNAEARSLVGWTPVHFSWQEGRPVVEWCQFGDRRWREPFFDQTVRAAHAGDCPRQLTSAEVLHAWADAVPELPLAGLIFHLSRCGSTLVSRMLGAVPANRVLSEPPMLAGVLASTADEAQRITWLRGLVHACAARRFPEERNLVVKLDPWQVLDLVTIQAAFPGVPAVFVYRDPVEILVSLSDNVAATFIPSPAGAQTLGLTYAQTLQVRTEEYCARALGCIAAAAATPQGRAWRLVNYTQLPQAVEAEIAPFFGTAFDEQARASMRSVIPFHAKAPGRLVFRADSARKQRDADEDLRTLAQRWVGSAYARLEERRRAQDTPPVR